MWVCVCVCGGVGSILTIECGERTLKFYPSLSHTHKHRLWPAQNCHCAVWFCVLYVGCINYWNFFPPPISFSIHHSSHQPNVFLSVSHIKSFHAVAWSEQNVPVLLEWHKDSQIVHRIGGNRLFAVSGTVTLGCLLSIISYLKFPCNLCESRWMATHAWCAGGPCQKHLTMCWCWRKKVMPTR